MENLAFHSLLRQKKNDCTPNALFELRGVKGLNLILLQHVNGESPVLSEFWRHSILFQLHDLLGLTVHMGEASLMAYLVGDGLN